MIPFGLSNRGTAEFRIAFGVAFIIVTLMLGGCTTRQDPGQWDAGLRYTLTHNCQADPDDPWKRC